MITHIAPINNRYKANTENPYQRKAKEQALQFLAVTNERRRNR